MPLYHTRVLYSECPRGDSVPRLWPSLSPPLRQSRSSGVSLACWVLLGNHSTETWVQLPGIGEVEAQGEKYQFDHDFYFLVLLTLNIERKSHWIRGRFPVRTNTSSLMVATRDARWMPSVCVTHSPWDEKRGCWGCWRRCQFCRPLLALWRGFLSLGHWVLDPDALQVALRTGRCEVILLCEVMDTGLLCIPGSIYLLTKSHCILSYSLCVIFIWL